MGTAPTELELKLTVTGAQFAALSAHPMLATYALCPAKSTQLRSVYFDTADHALHGAGISLRLRGSDQGFLQTVKSGTGVHAGVSNPVELETVIQSAHPELDRIDDPRIRRRIVKLIQNQPLMPVFETVIDRSIHSIVVDGTEIEIAFDQGSVRARQDQRTLCEIELELKAGEPAGIFAAAQLLMADTPVNFARKSKAARGYGLSARVADEISPPVRQRQPALRRSQPLSEALQQIFALAVEQIVGNWRKGAVDGDADAIHQLRVGLRRLRTALRLVGTMVEGPAVDGLALELQRLARVVGEVRDLDVLQTDVVVPALTELEIDSGPMLEVLADLRNQVSHVVQNQMGTADWNRMLLQITMLANGIGWTLTKNPDLHVVGRQGLDRSWKRVVKAAAGWESANNVDRHRLRRRLKELRYATNFFLTLFPGKKPERFLKNLKELQNRFGYLQDVAVSQRLIEITRQRQPPDADLILQAGLIVGWHTARAQGELKSAAQQIGALRKDSKFWR